MKITILAMLLSAFFTFFFALLGLLAKTMIDIFYVSRRAEYNRLRFEIQKTELVLVNEIEKEKYQISNNLDSSLSKASKYQLADKLYSLAAELAAFQLSGKVLWIFNKITFNSKKKRRKLYLAARALQKASIQIQIDDYDYNTFSALMDRVSKNLELEAKIQLTPEEHAELEESKRIATAGD